MATGLLFQANQELSCVHYALLPGPQGRYSHVPTRPCSRLLRCFHLDTRLLFQLSVYFRVAIRLARYFHMAVRLFPLPGSQGTSMAPRLLFQALPVIPWANRLLFFALQVFLRSHYAPLRGCRSKCASMWPLSAWPLGFSARHSTLIDFHILYVYTSFYHFAKQPQGPLL